MGRIHTVHPRFDKRPWGLYILYCLDPVWSSMVYDGNGIAECFSLIAKSEAARMAFISHPGHGHFLLSGSEPPSFLALRS